MIAIRWIRPGLQRAFRARIWFAVIVLSFSAAFCGTQDQLAGLGQTLVMIALGLVLGIAYVSRPLYLVTWAVAYFGVGVAIRCLPFTLMEAFSDAFIAQSAFFIFLSICLPFGRRVFTRNHFETILKRVRPLDSCWAPQKLGQRDHKKRPS